MQNKKKRIAAALLAGMMALSVFGGTITTQAAEMTPVGTPRAETLIVDILNGQQSNPYNCNPYMAGACDRSVGLGMLVNPPLWEMNTIEGAQYCDLAADFPEPLDDTNTKFRFHIREGITWSDGTPFTAADVEYTANMLLESETFTYGASFRTNVKSMTAVDDYTIEFEMVSPTVKPEQKLGNMVSDCDFLMVPKHIWENEDPESFTYENPLSLGAYVLTDRDPQGNWFLYEKREDWDHSDVGIIYGEPGPQYVLFEYFGSEEKRIMAMANNEIDILNDISPESWDILRSRNENAHCWTDSFPYATPDDPCERGICYNCTLEELASKEVRWALNLCLDIKQVNLATFSGKMKMSPIGVPPTTLLTEIYDKGMLDWLKEYSFEDGYQPFDENLPFEMVELLQEEGVTDLPTEEEDIIANFGIGWWKYDTEKATELLEKNGFTLKDGKWMTPSGEPFSIIISAPADFEVQSMRLAFAVADGWTKFGIDAQVQQFDSSTFWTNRGNGNFEAGAYWPYCGDIADVTSNLRGWHEKFIVDIGTAASGNFNRWDSSMLTENLNKLDGLKADDPEIITTVEEILKVLVDEMPSTPMFGTSKFVPYCDTYFTGFPNSENAYEGPWWWWSGFGHFLAHIQPRGAE